jgi:hypothetical protein
LIFTQIVFLKILLQGGLIYLSSFHYPIQLVATMAPQAIHPSDSAVTFASSFPHSSQVIKAEAVGLVLEVGSILQPQGLVEQILVIFVHLMEEANSIVLD